MEFKQERCGGDSRAKLVCIQPDGKEEGTDKELLGKLEEAGHKCGEKEVCRHFRAIEDPSYQNTTAECLPGTPPKGFDGDGNAKEEWKCTEEGYVVSDAANHEMSAG